MLSNYFLCALQLSDRMKQVLIIRLNIGFISILRKPFYNEAGIQMRAKSEQVFSDVLLMYEKTKDDKFNHSVQRDMLRGVILEMSFHVHES